jgi:formylglycine-generating enzyme required for sulfatase activity
MQYRNGIRCPSTFHSTKPINFICDLNQNGIGNETADGQTLACNFLFDYSRYFLDWAALRMMSELEYEKICRGPDYAYGGVISNEMPWALNGTIASNYTYVNNVTNSGAFNEIPANTGMGLFHAGGNAPTGPRRVGSTYSTTSTREQAGSSYYGVADMAGNLWEQVIRVMLTSYSRFDLGDGNVATTMPSTWETNYYRGGSYSDGYNYCTTSMRIGTYTPWTNTFSSNADYFARLGCRGAR